MSSIDLKREGAVFVLHMRSGENRFNPDFMQAFSAALDEAEASEGAAALVTTGEGKFYSNGLDLAAFSAGGPEVGATTMKMVHETFARLLEFPLATVAAINGHAFAGGFMLSMAQDFRVMREDRGFLCLPEIDLAMRSGFSKPMEVLLDAKLGSRNFLEMAITGRRYGAPEGVAKGFIDEAVAEDRVLARALEIAASLAEKDRETMRALKRNVHGAAIEKIRASAEFKV